MSETQQQHNARVIGLIRSKVQWIRATIPHATADDLICSIHDRAMDIASGAAKLEGGSETLRLAVELAAMTEILSSIDRRTDAP